MSRDADIVDYLLDELTPDERRRVERRIAEDELFRAEVERLRPLVSGLETLPEEAWDAGEVPPLPVLPPLPARGVGRFGRRVAVRPWIAAAAAIVAIAVGVGVGAFVQSRADAPATGASIALAPLGPAAPTAAGTATMVNDQTGMRLAVRGLAPSRSGQFYEVWLLDGPRRAMSLGSFRVPASGDALVTMPLPVNVADFRYLDVSVEKEDGNPGHSGDSVLRASTSA